MYKCNAIFLTILAFCGIAFGQTQINPASQIKWPQITGSGAPSATCSSANYGQPYLDVAATPNTAYTCGVGGWVANITAAQLQDALSDQTNCNVSGMFYVPQDNQCETPKGTTYTAYNLPSWATANTYFQVFRGKLDASTFSGSDIAAQITACGAQLIANGGGTCDAAMFFGKSFDHLVWGNGTTSMALIIPTGATWTVTSPGYAVTACAVSGNVATLTGSFTGLPTSAPFIPFAVTGFSGGCAGLSGADELYPTSVSATTIVVPLPHANITSVSDTGRVVIPGITQLNNTSIHPVGESFRGTELLLVAATGANLSHIYSTNAHTAFGGLYTQMSGIEFQSNSGAIFVGHPTYIWGLVDQSQYKNVLSEPPPDGTGIGFVSTSGCSTPAYMYARSFQGVIQAASPDGVRFGSGCSGTVTWGRLFTLNSGTGATFTTTLSGGHVASIAVTGGGSNYPSVNPFGFGIGGCCGSAVDSWQSGVQIGYNELATGVSTTSGSPTVTYTNITTDNMYKLIGASARTVDNIDPRTGNLSGETIVGTITSVTGTTITLSANATATNPNTTLEITPANAPYFSDVSRILLSNFTANEFYGYPGLPTVLVSQSSGLTLKNVYTEQDEMVSSSIPYIYIDHTNTSTVVEGVTCAFVYTITSQTCITSVDSQVEIHGLDVGSYHSGPVPVALTDKFWGTQVGQGLSGGGFNGYPMTMNYSHATSPNTIATFIPAQAPASGHSGCYRVVDTSLLPQGLPNVAGSFEISQAGNYADSLWDFVSSAYGATPSLTFRRANYSGSSWGSVTKLEMSNGASPFYYVDACVTTTSTIPVVITFDHASTLPGAAIIRNPVEDNSFPGGPTATVDLTTLAGSNPSGTTGSNQSHQFVVDTPPSTNTLACYAANGKLGWTTNTSGVAGTTCTAF